ncbi:uncharacterized protein LOC116305543 [Actinia tenebrosa]|uniref:Uncharacterized protein LOC116305543 n=1 Tax=Actinia tenebrosa TaxID=6105 RepID=A0A6P8IVM8_ACTTE|nr:uncharacterized protein LOC116305543 [Actinia tenebrosa]
MDLVDHLPFIHLDDESFRLALYELQQGPIRYQHDRLESLVFNPLMLEKNIAANSDLDPDVQYLNIPNSNYYISEQFNEITCNDNNNSKFSLLHLNARSINQNLTKLTDFLTTLDLTFSLIGITETWLDKRNSSSDYINIEGYNFIQKSRDDRPGGGVGLFIKDDINFKIRNDLTVFDSQILESIFIEIIRPHQRNVVIGVLYRPPNSNFQMFMNKLNEILPKFSKEQKDCYLMGDFNIDLLKYQQQYNNTNDFLDTMFSHAFLPIINRPTRITSHTATSIDNILILTV